MKAQSPDNIHWSFWLIAATTLVWNIICVVNFFWQINAEAIVNMPESHRLIIENRPLWATYAFAIAGFGGALGCLLLLLRNSRAYYLFALSLMAVILQLLPNFEMISLSVFAPHELFMMFLMPTFIAGFLVWYSWKAEQLGFIH